jgi:hypothetical protein
MADHIEHITDDEEQAAAVEWLEWCKQYMAKRDPLTRPIRQPKIKLPRYSEAQDFRTRLGFGCSIVAFRVAPILLEAAPVTVPVT